MKLVPHAGYMNVLSSLDENLLLAKILAKLEFRKMS